MSHQPFRFDDLRTGPLPTSGTLTITEEQLATFVAVTGERHPLHLHDDARPGVIPAGMLHSVCAGAMIRTHGPWDVAGLRRMRWHFVEPIRTGEKFLVESEIRALEPVTPTLGLVTLHRKITCPSGETLAQATIEIAVHR